jgi:hypothetical protein
MLDCERGAPERPSPDRYNDHQRSQRTEGVCHIPVDVLREVVVRLEAEAGMVARLGQAARGEGPYCDLPNDLIGEAPHAALSIGNPARRCLRALLAGDETELGVER